MRDNAQLNTGLDALNDLVAIEDLPIEEQLSHYVDKARRLLDNPPAAPDSYCVYAGQGIGILKELKNLLWQVAKERRKDVKALLQELTKRLYNLDLDNGQQDTVKARKYKSIIRHYAIENLDGIDLGGIFNSVRKEYGDNLEDASILVEYGWVLHDCLNKAVKLCSAELTEYFLDFAKKILPTAEKLKDSLLEKKTSVFGVEGLERLASSLKRGIEAARDMLANPSELRKFCANGQWEAALKEAEVRLERDPKDMDAYRHGREACLKIGEARNKNRFVLSSKVVYSHCGDDESERWFLKDAGDWFYTVIKQHPSSVEDSQYKAEQLREFVGLMVELFPYCSHLEKKTEEYSRYLSITTSAFLEFLNIFKMRQNNRTVSQVIAGLDEIFEGKSGPNRSNASLYFISKKLRREMSAKYLEFVGRDWNIRNNFREEDKKRVASSSGKFYLPLQAKVALAIFDAVQFVAKQYPVEECERLVCVAETSEHLFKPDWTKYNLGAAKAWMAIGECDKARGCAINLVTQSLHDAWRWMVLATAFQDGAAKRKACLEAANELGIGHAIPDQAFAIVCEGAKTYKGNVLTCFDDLASGNQNVRLQKARLWWENDKGEGCVAFRDDVSKATPGMPVEVLVRHCNGVDVVLDAAGRRGRDFDCYPYTDAVVMRVEANKGLYHIAYGELKECKVDARRHSWLKGVKSGKLCRLAILERNGSSPVVLDVKAAVRNAKLPSFVMPYNGVLQHINSSRDAKVGEVLVPAYTYLGKFIGNEVSGLAVKAKGKTSAKFALKAITCQTRKGFGGVVEGGAGRKCSRGE